MEGPSTIAPPLEPSGSFGFPAYRPPADDQLLKAGTMTIPIWSPAQDHIHCKGSKLSELRCSPHRDRPRLTVSRLCVMLSVVWC